ncbi:MAG: AcvB/VirJ family lysyl-phosphatidylglycerol hydrolase [Sphingobium sp.]
MQQQPDATSDRHALTALVAAVPHASLIDLPGNSVGEAGADMLGARTATAIHALLPPPPPKDFAGQVPIPDMPLTIVPPARGRQSDLMAIAYSGDGGWVGIDRDLAAQVAAAGIPVVGVDSLSYFWSARNPKRAGEDLSRLIRSFGERWNKRRVLLIGYSFGADALPYMIDALDADARSRIDSVALLGLSSTADFQFHLTSWINVASSDSLPTIPAITRLRGLTIRCVRGAEETDSACPAIPKGLAQQFVVPGGHHFDRNAPLLGRIVLGQRKPGMVVR